tara:strand:- start:5 stop:148 length:144 start_codon:yes stop_codon:yes gene_type:complete
MTDLLLDTLFDIAPFFFRIKEKEVWFTHTNEPFKFGLAKAKPNLLVN